MSSQLPISLQDFLSESPSPYHVVQTCINILKQNGFQHARESQEIPKDKPTIYSRDSTSFVAYIPGTDFSTGFSSVMSHSDSPTLRILQQGTITQNGSTMVIPCEPYSGPVLARWMDRILQLAGRVAYIQDNKVCFKQILLKNYGFIPSLAPHMLRGTDQKDWIPENGDFIVCIPKTDNLKDKMSVTDYVKIIAGLPETCEITAIMLEFSGQESTRFGSILQAPRLDNLASVYASLAALIASLKAKQKTPHTRMIWAFNNEEVGSNTRAGAEGPMVLHWWARLSGFTNDQFASSLARSFAASADGGHAKHPIKGAPSCNDPVPVLGGGILMKLGQKQNYAFTDNALSVAKMVCRSSNVQFQDWVGRSYKLGGGTIGNIVSAHSDLIVVDCGIPMLGMHSCVETCDIKDVEQFIAYCQGILDLACQVLEQVHDVTHE